MPQKLTTIIGKRREARLFHYFTYSFLENTISLVRLVLPGTRLSVQSLSGGPDDIGQNNIL